jgi:hypothetical protein
MTPVRRAVPVSAGWLLDASIEEFEVLLGDPHVGQRTGPAPLSIQALPGKRFVETGNARQFHGDGEADRPLQFQGQRCCVVGFEACPSDVVAGGRQPNVGQAEPIRSGTASWLHSPWQDVHAGAESNLNTKARQCTHAGTGAMMGHQRREVIRTSD